MNGTPPQAGQEAAGSRGDSVRLDVWLWAVRLFKTRSMATEACRLGRVTRPNGETVKPSRSVRTGDEWLLEEEFLKRRVRVEQLLNRRVGAKLVPRHMSDLTAPEELEKARLRRVEQRMTTPVFVPGAGRPTKAQRRALEAWHAAALGTAAAGEEE